MFASVATFVNNPSSTINPDIKWRRPERFESRQVSHFLLSCDVLFQSKREISDLSCTAVTDEDCWSLMFIAAVSVRRDETG